MNKIILITIAILFASCSKSEEEGKLHKPFLIVGKSLSIDSEHSYYTAQDSAGKTFQFSDKSNAFKIGDEIK